MLDLNKIIKEANQLGRRTLRNNVSVELRPTAKPIRVKMDPTKASQALLNLCVNAQDAMPEGGRLTLTNTIVEPSPELMARHNLAAGGLYARCSVADTGCGIRPTCWPAFLSRFSPPRKRQGHRPRPRPSSSGSPRRPAGLSRWRARSPAAPLFTCTCPSAGTARAGAATATALLVQGKGRVLVVDDVDLLRDFTQKFLQMTGLNVLVASSGPQAIKVLEESAEPVDLLFTDYNMPGMNGLELIEDVAKRWPETKFVLASGFLNDADLRPHRTLRCQHPGQALRHA